MVKCHCDAKTPAWYVKKAPNYGVVYRILRKKAQGKNRGVMAAAFVLRGVPHTAARRASVRTTLCQRGLGLGFRVCGGGGGGGGGPRVYAAGAVEAGGYVNVIYLNLCDNTVLGLDSNPKPYFLNP